MEHVAQHHDGVPAPQPTVFGNHGRAYVQGLAPAFLLAALGHGQFVRPGHTPADGVLCAVKETESAEDLREFIEAAAHELELLLGRLIERPLLSAD